jgi:hypothetical protein
LIGASTSGADVDRHVYRFSGLNPKHAFAVLASTSLPSGAGRFLLIRDPHGSTDYSDDSITPSDRTYLHSIHPEVQNSGIFWIAWSNFLQLFVSITISTYVEDHFDIREVAQFTQSSSESIPVYYFTVSE